ncbi:MAG: hypothetical protein EP335_17570 [Alphaproteobacteria bacterium]|nr:MAG: hypothetical protein EP335_17570 [Alphaproteobacteria bacterium]
MPAFAMTPEPVALPAPGASAGTGGKEKPIRIYWPIGYYSDENSRPTEGAARALALLSETGVAFTVVRTPVRRAFLRYTRDPDSCIMSIAKPVHDDDIISIPVTISEHWLYVRADAGIKELADVRTAATLEGAERFFDFGNVSHVRWQFVPTYQALVAMLDGGRVDAVTLGPPVEEGLVAAPHNAVRLGSAPLVTLVNRVLCHASARSRHFIDGINSVSSQGRAVAR